MKIKGRYLVVMTTSFMVLDANSEEHAIEKAEYIFREPERRPNSNGWRGQGWISKPERTFRANYCPDLSKPLNRKKPIE
jgi:hypothetical protein|tara:strand:+ start:81 stop:317 length:237 start_codon:yes stop_codon:yes gene_type:complete